MTEEQEADPSQWVISEGDYNGFYREVELVSPSGFRITLDGKQGCLRALWNLMLRGSVWLVDDGSKLQILPEGQILVLDTDPWINKGCDFGEPVSNTTALSKAIIKYLSAVVSDGE